MSKVYIFNWKLPYKHGKWCRICPIVKYYMFAHRVHVYVFLAHTPLAILVSLALSNLKSWKCGISQMKQQKLFSKIINWLFPTASSVSIECVEHCLLSPWQDRQAMQIPKCKRHIIWFHTEMQWQKKMTQTARPI